MSAHRFGLIVTLAALPIVGSGCIGAGTDGSWPPGTQAVVSSSASRVLAAVPVGQWNKAVGRRWVPIATGTRVVARVIA